MYKIEMVYIWVILKKVDQTFFKIMANRVDKGGHANLSLLRNRKFDLISQSGWIISTQL